MKNLLLTGSILLALTSVTLAQTDTTKFNLTSKRGFYYFPEKGDWSLSINANPFLEYLGNMIGNQTITNNYNNGFYSYNISNNAPKFAFTAQNPGTIYFKYYSQDNRAWRIKLLFGYSSSKDKDGSGEETPKNVYLTQKALAIGLSVGQEFYRPIKSRIRGYYGYEAGILSTPYRGSLYNSNNSIVTGNVEYVNETMPESEFKEEGGNTLGFNGAGILGVEWFFAPKISLGGEFGLGFEYAKQKERKYITDENKIIVDSGGNRFSFEPYASGDLILHIYF
ncbi:hypothetical protein [Carboxylicivirga taeanensis]|uniref:hypothetical protein n=1 Tax=Carboxylicivirga taeanensis TaxID=1416875 RepID=UPI003F6DFF9E